MSKKYVLLVKNISKYEDFNRLHFKYFEDYLSLQKHLLRFKYMPRNTYIIFEETNIKIEHPIMDNLEKTYYNRK